MRFFGRPSRHRRRTSVISTIVTSRYIQGLLRRAEARAGDVYRAVRRRGKGFEKLSAQRGKGFEKVLTEGSIGFENRHQPSMIVAMFSRHQIRLSAIIDRFQAAAGTVQMLKIVSRSEDTRTLSKPKISCMWAARSWV